MQTRRYLLDPTCSRHSFDRHIEGTVLRKVYKHGPADVTELHRSIEFKIDFIRATGPASPPTTQALQTTEVPAALEDNRIPTNAEVVPKAAGGEQVERLKLMIEGIEPAPFQRLLTKVERFNSLMKGISEVRLPIH